LLNEKQEVRQLNRGHAKKKKNSPVSLVKNRFLCFTWL